MVSVFIHGGTFRFGEGLESLEEPVVSTVGADVVHERVKVVASPDLVLQDVDLIDEQDDVNVPEPPGGETGKHAALPNCHFSTNWE